jgi:hyperosmotically inducible protein
MNLSRTLAVVVGALLVMSFSACQSMTGRSAGRVVDDAKVTTQVKAKLAAEKPSSLTRISVKTVNGIVYLQGVVDTVNDKVLAEEVARRVTDVSNVVNELQIASSGSASPGSR